MDLRIRKGRVEPPPLATRWLNFSNTSKEIGIPLETVSKIYNGETLTKEMVLSIVNELEDWEQLEADLNEIDYPYKFELM